MKTLDRLISEFGVRRGDGWTAAPERAAILAHVQALIAAETESLRKQVAELTRKGEELCGAYGTALVQHPKDIQAAETIRCAGVCMTRRDRSHQRYEALKRQHPALTDAEIAASARAVEANDCAADILAGADPGFVSVRREALQMLLGHLDGESFPANGDSLLREARRALGEE